MKRLPVQTRTRKQAEPVREAILRILKLSGTITVKELCRRMNLTHTGIRRYLAELESKGLIEFELQQQTQGRPFKQYRLAAGATNAFPNSYEQLVEDMLATVFAGDGHKSVMAFLKANNDRSIVELEPRFSGKNLAQRIAELARYFAANGYMTEYIHLPDGNYFLYHQNCAILHAASKYRQFCILEPRLIECLLQTKIYRQKYILKGDEVCGYLVLNDTPRRE